jgi:putative copper export protein
MRAPVALPEGGRRLASMVLARFSRIALWAVGLIVVTGLLRLTGELSRVAELWSSDYGRSLLMKSLLLCPVAWLALRNRRAIRGLLAGGAALRAVRRNVRTELAIGLNIVVIAALLVAQIPGRDAPSAAAPARAASVAQVVAGPR